MSDPAVDAVIVGSELHARTYAGLAHDKPLGRNYPR